MTSAPLFSKATVDAMGRFYAQVGTPIRVQVWDPDARRLKTETLWVDGIALPGFRDDEDEDE